MSERKKKAARPLSMPFGEALARFVQTNPKELEDAYDETRRAEAEAKQFIEERERSIRQGARGVRRPRS
jgi:hypothetical protein